MNILKYVNQLNFKTLDRMRIIKALRSCLNGKRFLMLNIYSPSQYLPSQTHRCDVVVTKKAIG